MMAYCLVGLGNYDEAKCCAEKCLEIAQSDNNQQDIGLAHNILGMIGLVRGEYPSARLYFEQSQVCLEKIQHPMSIMNLFYMSYTDRKMGERDKASRHLVHGIKALLDRGILLYGPQALSSAALLAADRGSPQHAICLYNLAYSFPTISQSRFQ